MADLRPAAVGVEASTATGEDESNGGGGSASDAASEDVTSAEVRGLCHLARCGYCSFCAPFVGQLRRVASHCVRVCVCVCVSDVIVLCPNERT